MGGLGQAAFLSVVVLHCARSCFSSMAWRTTLKLPKFRVHHRASGYEKRSLVSRGQLVASASASAIEPGHASASPPDVSEAACHEHSYSLIGRWQK